MPAFIFGEPRAEAVYRAVVSVLWFIVWLVTLAARKGWDGTKTVFSPSLKNSTPT